MAPRASHFVREEVTFSPELPKFGVEKADFGTPGVMKASFSREFGWRLGGGWAGVWVGCG